MKNTIQYVVGNVDALKRQLKEKYINLGYKKLSMNIFIDNDNVIVIRSMVEKSNPNEWKCLSLDLDLYEKIKNKSITILLLERKRKIDIFHKQYQIKVNSLTPTDSHRSWCRYRFIINEFTQENNITEDIYEGFGLAS